MDEQVMLSERVESVFILRCTHRLYMRDALYKITLATLPSLCYKGVLH